jgi:hypothetical protein
LELDQADAIDLTKLSEQELNALGSLLERANQQLDNVVLAALPAPEKGN